MIPISDQINSNYKPVATLFIIGLTVSVFCAEINLEITGELSKFILNWAIIPAQLHKIATDAFQQQNPAAFLLLIGKGIQALFGTVFLHASFAQILGNMLFLWVFGQRVEEILGIVKFGLFYLICGSVFSLGDILIQPAYAGGIIGANGAIAGILGFYAGRFFQAQIETIIPLIVVFIPVEVPVILYLFWWFLQQTFYGIGSLGVNAQGVSYIIQLVAMILGAIWGRQIAEKQSEQIS